MKAAVVTAFGQPPTYQDHPEPTPAAAGETVVDVVAAGLHPRVRSQAAGTHYTSGSTEVLPLVPGIDGVGRTQDGTLRYFVLPDTALGAMAQRTVIDVRRSVELPAGTDPVQIAAAMNPAMSSWLALRRRIDFEPGQRVMVLGATGNAGQLAVQIAKRLGAAQVIAVGRDATRLAALRDVGADVCVRLDQGPDSAAAALGEAADQVDVVLDYLWGRPTAAALKAVIPRRADDAQQLTWIQIGSVAGLESPIPSAALRATRLQIVGSGQGSVSTRDIVAELPLLAREISAGAFAVNARALPLADVEPAWAEAATARERLVLTS